MPATKVLFGYKRLLDCPESKKFPVFSLLIREFDEESSSQADCVIRHLFGLRQAYLNFRGIPCPPPEFRVSGLYRHLRHPLLAGFIVAFWATPEMTLGHLIFALATTGYMAIGILFEERDLIALYGEPYAEYRRQVWAVLPLGSVDESFSERLLKGSGSTVGT